MQKPSLGRFVQTRVDPAQNNGSDVASAQITRVFNDDMVNIRVMLDAFTVPLWLTSVKLVCTTDSDEAKSAVPAGASVAWWPPRV